MDYGIFNVCTDVNACNCMWGCPDTVRESALQVDSERKILYCTRESNLCWWRAGPMLYQLSYIPVPCGSVSRGQATEAKRGFWTANQSNQEKLLHSAM